MARCPPVQWRVDTGKAFPPTSLSRFQFNAEGNVEASACGSHHIRAEDPQGLGTFNCVLITHQALQFWLCLFFGLAVVVDNLKLGEVWAHPLCKYQALVYMLIVKRSSWSDTGLELPCLHWYCLILCFLLFYMLPMWERMDGCESCMCHNGCMTTWFRYI